MATEDYWPECVSLAHMLHGRMPVIVETDDDPEAALVRAPLREDPEEATE